MRRILDFLLGNRVRLLFWFYMVLALVLTVNNNLFYKSSFLNTSNEFSGNIHLFFSGIDDYFSLKSENEFLQEQNRIFQERWANSIPELKDPLPVFDNPKTSEDSLYVFPIRYTYTSGKIIKNSYNGINNYLTLSLGKQDSIHQDMGVVNDKGIIGIVERSGTAFSTVQSILHSKSKINAKIKGSNYFGSLVWNGKNPNIVQLRDVPNLAPIKKGDTIITGGMSSIFPESIPIGVISDIGLTEAKNYYVLQIALFNKMQNIGVVYVIKNFNSTAIKAIEEIENE
jgi:rod shape-determining protein MreC